MRAVAVRLSARVRGLIVALLAFIAPPVSGAAISPRPNKRRNLAANEPQRTSGLRAQLEAELQAMGVRFPIPSGALP
jgi:hypothetical protein